MTTFPAIDSSAFDVVVQDVMADYHDRPSALNSRTEECLVADLEHQILQAFGEQFLSVTVDRTERGKYKLCAVKSGGRGYYRRTITLRVEWAPELDQRARDVLPAVGQALFRRGGQRPLMWAGDGMDLASWDSVDELSRRVQYLVAERQEERARQLEEAELPLDEEFRCGRCLRDIRSYMKRDSAGNRTHHCVMIATFRCVQNDRHTWTSNNARFSIADDRWILQYCQRCSTDQEKTASVCIKSEPLTDETMTQLAQRRAHAAEMRGRGGGGRKGKGKGGKGGKRKGGDATERPDIESNVVAESEQRHMPSLCEGCLRWGSCSGMFVDSVQVMAAWVLMRAEDGHVDAIHEEVKWEGGVGTLSDGSKLIVHVGED